LLLLLLLLLLLQLLLLLLLLGLEKRRRRWQGRRGGRLFTFLLRLEKGDGLNRKIGRGK